MSSSRGCTLDILAYLSRHRRVGNEFLLMSGTGSLAVQQLKVLWILLEGDGEIGKRYSAANAAMVTKWVKRVICLK